MTLNGSLVGGSMQKQSGQLIGMELEELSLQPAIRSYLDDVARYLHGFIPKSEVGVLLCESAYWLQRRANQLEKKGLTAQAAAEKAVEMNDSPRNLAFTLIEDYFESRHHTWFYRTFGRGNLTAFAFFGVANMMYLGFLQLSVYFPSTEPLKLDVSPALVRMYYPEPLPFPDWSWQFILTAGFPLLAPFLVGWLVGQYVPVRSAAAVSTALMPIIIYAFLMGVALLPSTTGLFYAILQTFYWLPVGCVMAHLSSSRLRHKRQSPRIKAKGKR